MAWTYQSFTADNRNDLWSKITNALNSLDTNACQTAKAVVFDTLQETNAIGGVIYLETSDAIPAPGSLGSTWQRKKFTSLNNDNNGAFDALVKFMNDAGNGLTPTQCCWSTLSTDVDKVGTANRSHYIILWYRVHSDIS